MQPPKLEKFIELDVQLDPITEMGEGRAGKRRIIPIMGGYFKGKISGRVLSVGADWQTIFADGLAELDTRYALETEDGAIIEVINYGLRHGPAEVMEQLAKGEAVPPDAYYMRTHARLETGDPRYLHLNRTLFVGTGQRMASSVHIELFSLL
jgi:hypothetical protein